MRRTSAHHVTVVQQVGRLGDQLLDGHTHDVGVIRVGVEDELHLRPAVLDVDDLLTEDATPSDLMDDRHPLPDGLAGHVGSCLGVTDRARDVPDLLFFIIYPDCLHCFLSLVGKWDKRHLTIYL